MNFLLPGLRRGWNVATRPLRLGRRLRQMDARLVELAERVERTQQQLEQLRQQSHKLQLLSRLLGKLPPLEQLRLLYPWPAERPAVAPCDRGWDGGGRDIVTRRLAERPTKVILEIGSFLGLSTRGWLTAAPGATIVCIDPWFDFYEDDSSLRDWPDVLGKNIYHLFLSSCWEFRDRIVPVRAFSPAALQEVADLGVQPDLIYIDGNHDYQSVRTDIEEAHRLFPQAILTGDDWAWDCDPLMPFAVRKAVEDFAAAKGWRVEAKGNTWALDR